MKKLLAFTLSETLITLGIIGVVATLTLPNLTSRYKAKVYTAQIQKLYNQLSKAAIDLKTDNRVDSVSYTYLSENTDGAGRFLKTYFKVINDCGTENRANCFAPAYKTAANTAYNLTLSGYCVLLDAGSSVCVNTMTDGAASVIVDSNGKKAPNKKGKDLFEFSLYADGTIGGGDLGSLINSGWEISE